MQLTSRSRKDLIEENDALRIRLEEAEDMLRAIRGGEVDALVIQSAAGPKVYTLQGDDAEASRMRGEMLAQVGDAVIAVDANDCIIFLNSAAERLYDMPFSQAIGRPRLEIYTLRWLQPGDEAAARETLRKHGAWRGETIQVPHDGRVLHVEASVTALRDKAGQMTGMLGVMRDVSARKVAEGLLLASEEFNRSLMDGSADCVKVLDLDGRVLHMNVPGLCLMEIDDFEKLRGAAWSSLWPPAVGQHVARAVATALAGDTYSFEAFGPTAKGTPRWWDVVVSPIRNAADGAVVRILSVSRDITERKRAEEARAESAERVRLATEAAQLGFWSWQPDEDIIGWENEYPHQIVGLAPAAPRVSATRLASEFVLAEDSAGLVQAMARTARGGEPLAFTGRFRRRDGQTRWVEVKGRWAPPGGSRAPRVIGTIQDITDRKTAEASLRRSETRYRRLFEAALDGVLLIDPATRKIVDANPFMTGLLGQPRDALVGKELFEIGFLADAQASQEMFLALKATQQMRYDNLPLRSVDGKRREVEVVANLHDEDGHAVVQCNVRDITERRQSEDALRETEERQRLVLEACEIGTFYGDLENDTPTWNSVEFELLGLRPGDAPPSPSTLFRHVHPDDIDALQAKWAQANEVMQSDTEFRIVRADGEIRWLAGRWAVFSEERDGSGGVGRPQRYLGVNFDITERKRAEEHAHLLMGEVNHRAKNLLAVVQAVTHQTAKHGDPATFGARLADRIDGLAASHDLLVKNLWHGVEMTELVAAQLAHFKDVIGTRITMDGPPSMLTTSAAQAIGMALHELATNAAKYGALSNTDGRVRIAWQTTAAASHAFSMSWLEEGGPKVQAPTHKGFGQLVIKRMAETAVDGVVEIAFAENGLSWCLSAPAGNVLIDAAGAT